MATPSRSLEEGDAESDDRNLNQASVTGVLTLKRVLSLVLVYSPALKGVETEVRAREAERLQAGFLPNPEVSAQIENFAGSNPYTGFHGAETTIELTQLIELGGERSSRVRQADAARELAGWDYEAQRLSVLTRATERFIDVLASQDRVALSRQLLEIANQLSAAVQQQVTSGKVTPIDATRAEIVAAQAQSQMESSVTELHFARRQLALLWGAGDAHFDHVIGSFPSTERVPPADTLEKYLSYNPAVARWAAELAGRQADFAFAKAKSIPDVTVGIGGRRIADTGSNALVATLSVPLPIFDRNQGAIAAARHRIEEAQYDGENAEEQIETAFFSAYGQLAVAATKLKRLESDILPRAESVFDRISTGYREGKFDLLNVLDAQRTLFQARLDAVDARASFYGAKTEVEGLIGRGVDTVLSSGTGPEGSGIK